MVQQTVYGITNDHYSLAVNIVNYFECEVKIFYHQFAPIIAPESSIASQPMLS